MPIKKGIQFGRYVEVEVKNYLTGEVITIPNQFEIDFEFFKTIDENENASTGTISIKGLTKETYDRMNSEGGSVTLRCGYTNSEIKILFISMITRMWQVRDNGTTTTNINCSANSLEYFYNSYDGGGNGERTIAEVLLDTSKLAGASGIGFDLSNIPKEKVQSVSEYIRTHTVRTDFEGVVRDVLKVLCDAFMLSRSSSIDEDGTTTFMYSFTQAGVNFTLKKIAEGYSKAPNPDQRKRDRYDFKSIFITPEDRYKDVYILSRNTGLRKVEEEYKIATSYETVELAANEVQTTKSKNTIAQSNAKRREQDEKDAKRKADGKEVKERVRTARTIKINRKYAKVTALLNPSVTPQGHIIVSSLLDQYDSVYRVREATYKGNNRKGDWEMVLYCEDSGNRYSRPATQEEIEASNQDGVFYGSLGDQSLLDQEDSGDSGE
jgi:hypothetical protein